jgi:hypothetical protein
MLTFVSVVFVVCVFALCPKTRLEFEGSVQAGGSKPPEAVAQGGLERRGGLQPHPAAGRNGRGPKGRAKAERPRGHLSSAQRRSTAPRFDPQLFDSLAKSVRVVENEEEGRHLVSSC